MKLKNKYGKDEDNFVKKNKQKNKEQEKRKNEGPKKYG